MQPVQFASIAAASIFVVLVLFLFSAPVPSSASFIVMNVVGEARVRANSDQCPMPACDRRDHKLVPRADVDKINSTSCAVSVVSGSSSISLFDDSKWQFPEGRYQFETTCCSAHHQCYSDCTTSKEQCDSRFFNCAIQRCASQFDLKIPTNDDQPLDQFLMKVERDASDSKIDTNKLFLECTRWATCYAAQSAEDGCSVFRALRNNSCECVLANIDDPILAIRDQEEKDEHDAITDPIYEEDDDDGDVHDVDAHHRAHIVFGAFNAEGLRALNHDGDDDDEDDDGFFDDDDMMKNSNSTSSDLPIPSLSALVCPPRSTDSDRPTNAAHREHPLKGRTSLLLSLALTTLILLVA